MDTVLLIFAIVLFAVSGFAALAPEFSSWFEHRRRPRLRDALADLVQAKAKGEQPDARIALEALGRRLSDAAAGYALEREAVHAAGATNAQERRDGITAAQGESTGPLLRTHRRPTDAASPQLPVSVQQAHDMAEALERSDPENAKRSLKSIVEQELPGDPDDYHNAHTQAMRMLDISLALQLVDAGLRRFPDYYDLVADRALALRSLGRADEAFELLRDFRERKPAEFSRGWRPVAFLAETIKATELTEQRVAFVTSALREATDKLPHEPRVWSEFAGFLQGIGQVNEATEILDQATKLNPYSQVLHYRLGELLLAQGNAKAAVHALEAALRTDLQDQYQHDVNQFAVVGTLAQAYEAAGALPQAERHYRLILDSTDPGVSGTIRRYAAARLRAIGLSQEQPSGEVQGEVALRLSTEQLELKEMLPELRQLLMVLRSARLGGESEPADRMVRRFSDLRVIPTERAR